MLNKINFSTSLFVRRLDRNLFQDFEVFESTKEILANLFFKDIDSKYEDKFFKLMIEDEVTIKFMRKILRSNEFESWAEDYLESYISEFLDKLTYLKKSNSIKIYRSITCTYDWINKASKSKKISTGNCWSYLYEGAIPYHGCPSDQEFIFHGEINLSNIDWFRTIILNLVFPYGEDEQEIRTYAKKRIKNFSVERVGDILHSQFSKKIYT